MFWDILLFVCGLAFPLLIALAYEEHQKRRLHWRRRQALNLPTSASAR